MLLGVYDFYKDLPVTSLFLIVDPSLGPLRANKKETNKNYELYIDLIHFSILEQSKFCGLITNFFGPDTPYILSFLWAACNNKKATFFSPFHSHSQILVHITFYNCSLLCSPIHW